MNKKVLSLALAVTMMASVTAQAATNLKDYVGGGSYSSCLDGGLFSYTKYNQVWGNTPAKVAPEIETAVKTASSSTYGVYSTSALYSTSANNVFDYKVTLKMDKVLETLNNVYDKAELVFDLDENLDDTAKAAMKTQVGASTVEGNFAVTISYDNTKLSHAALTAADVVLTQNGVASNIFEIDEANCDFTAANPVVAFKVKGTPDVATLKANANGEMADVVVEISGFTAAVTNENISVSASMTGKTTFKDNRTEYAFVDYETQATTNDTAMVYLTTSTGGSLGGGSSYTPSKPNTDNKDDSNTDDKDDNNTDEPAIDEPSTDNKDDNNTDEPAIDEPTNGFGDVNDTDWFADSVKYVVENGLMSGVSNEEFAPTSNLTRAMLVAILYRAAGEPEVVNKSIPFADVSADSYYAQAVIWAQQNNIVAGMSDNEFAPDVNITREQIATIIYRFAQFMGYDVTVAEDADLSAFEDMGDISEYAVDAMRYAVASGLIKGKTETTLNPADTATRAEIAAILQRFIEANK